MISFCQINPNYEIDPPAKHKLNEEFWLEGRIENNLLLD